MAGNSNRPLSPHLEIWRWGPAMTVSILHRISGNGLTFAGGALLLWWLGALAGGEASYNSFSGWDWADFSQLEWSGFAAIVVSLVKVALKLVLIGCSWAFFNHMASGLRHFVLDIGAGYELEANKRWSVISMIAGVLLTIAFWAALLF